MIDCIELMKIQQLMRIQQMVKIQQMVTTLMLSLSLCRKMMKKMKVKSFEYLI